MIKTLEQLKNIIEFNIDNESEITFSISNLQDILTLINKIESIKYSNKIEYDKTEIMELIK